MKVVKLVDEIALIVEIGAARSTAPAMPPSASCSGRKRYARCTCESCYVNQRRNFRALPMNEGSKNRPLTLTIVSAARLVPISRM